MAVQSCDRRRGLSLVGARVASTQTIAGPRAHKRSASHTNKAVLAAMRSLHHPFPLLKFWSTSDPSLVWCLLGEAVRAGLQSGRDAAACNGVTSISKDPCNLERPEIFECNPEGGEDYARTKAPDRPIVKPVAQRQQGGPALGGRCTKRDPANEKMEEERKNSSKDCVKD